MPLADASTDRKAARAALAEMLWDAGATRHAVRLDRCGEKLWIVCTQCGRTHQVETRCDLRWCPSCQPLLARRTVERLMPAAQLVRWPLFVTFTVRNYPTADSVRQVRRAFTKLRRHRWWKARVAGGVANVEITNRGKGWHPHIHALLDCRWLSVTVPPPRAGDDIKKIGKRAASEVAEAWSDCVGRKGSVKVRRVWTRDDGSLEPALREVLKYSVKPDELATMRATQVVDAIDAIDRTRLLVTWGNLYRRPELAKRKAPLACECGAIGCMAPEKFV